MNMAERVLERITPRSALGLTLLTLAVIVLMLGFFIQDIHVAGLNDEMDDECGCPGEPNLIPQPDASIRLGPVSHTALTHDAEPRRIVRAIAG